MCTMANFDGYNDLVTSITTTTTTTVWVPNLLLPLGVPPVILPPTGLMTTWMTITIRHFSATSRILTPKDTSPRDMRGDWILLFCGQSMTCNKQYSKTIKISIFHDSLTIENRILLGDAPPRDMEKICTIYRGIATRHRTWKFDDIAGSVNKLAKFVCDRQKDSAHMYAALVYSTRRILLALH